MYIINKQEDSLNPISQNLKNFAKKYCQQFPDFNDTMRQDIKIRESTPFHKDVDSEQYGAVDDKNKSWIVSIVKYVLQFLPEKINM